MKIIENTAFGSKYLIDGDEKLGFFGEVPANNLIDNISLSALLSVEEGTMLYSDTPWLKFIDDNVIKFVAKQPFRYNISWDDLESLKLIYGNAVIIIKGYEFRVRLIQGSNDQPTYWNPDEAGSSYDWITTHNSEWNRLMYPIHENTPPSQTRPNYTYPEFSYDDNNDIIDRIVYTRKKITPGEDRFLKEFLSEYDYYLFIASQWRPYKDIDLAVADNFGRNTWCQETWAFNEKYKVQRGCDGISYTTIRKRDDRNESYGWRPLLELINR